MVCLAQDSEVFTRPKVCEFCKEPIDKENPGLRMNEFQLAHRECLVRSVIGSVGHQMRECSCYGKVDTSEDGLSLREAARRSFRYYVEHGR